MALARLAETRPDIIMLDLMMPEMGGFEFLDRIAGAQTRKEDSP